MVAATGVVACVWGVAACGGGGESGGGGGSEGSGAATGAEQETGPGDEGRSPSPAAPVARDGTDVAACHDGDCEVALTGPVDIELDGELGVGVVSVTEIDAEKVTLSCNWSYEEADSSGGSSGAVASRLAPGNVLPCNDLELRVTEIAAGTAVLVMAPVAG